MTIDTLPLFVTDTAGSPDLDELKARLRLTGIKVDEDAEQILHSVVLGVRGKFYGRLGISRVSAISSTNPVVAPTTDSTIIRSIAYECEVMWVLVDLMCRMPMVFMDNSSNTDEIFNQEGVFRSMDPEQLKDCREVFEAQIVEWLAILAQEVSLGQVGGPNTGRAFTQSSQIPKIYPAGSLRSDNAVLFTNPAALKALGLTT